MPRANPLLPAVNAGEFSPDIVARLDVTRYDQAAEILRNMVVKTQGGAFRRPGSRHVRPTKVESDRSRIMRFQFNDEQAYVTELGHLYARFFRNQGVIVVPATDAAIVNGTFDSDIASWSDESGAGSSIAHDAVNQRLNLTSNGTTDAHAEQSVTVGAGFINVEHVLKFQTFGAPGDTIKLRIGTTTTGNELVDDLEFETGFHCHNFTPGATTVFVQFLHGTGKTLQVDNVSLINDAPIEIDSPWGIGDVASLKRAQTADVMYMTRGGLVVPSYKLARRGNTSWSLIEVAWQDGPWGEQNEETARTLQASAVTGLGITITAAGHSPFAATDVGRSVRLQDAATEPGWAVITAFTSSTVVVADVKRDFNATTTTEKWRLGAWSSTTGYPKAVSFFEQRLYAANTTTQPQTFWGTQSADVENFRPDSFVDGAVVIEDDDGLDYTIAADDVNPILWLSPGQNLVLGTFGGEWLARSDGAVITPTDIDVKRQTTHGSAEDIEPVRVGAVVVFIQKGRRKARAFEFDLDQDTFQAPDLTIFSDHVTKTGIVDMDLAEEPDSIVWCVRTDGRLAALTFKREQNQIGWGRSILGGSFDGGIAEVESVVTIPGNTTTNSQERDEIWLQVKRTINGQTRRYIEFFEAEYENPLRDDYANDAAWKAAILAAQQDVLYVDSGLSYDGVATTTVTGADHLEGQTVKILADGAIHPDRVVTGGAVTLDQAASKVHLGLAYEHKYKSLKLNAGAAAGTAVGKIKRIHAVSLVLDGVAEGSLEIGPDDANLETIFFREVADAMDTAVPLFTGEYRHEFPGDHETDARIICQGSAPTPFGLLAVAPELKTYEQV